jgi:hypothetical protein
MPRLEWWPISGSIGGPATEEHLPSIRGIPGPYGFFFYSFECVKPMHVHVERDEATCKFWLRPLTLAETLDSRLEISTTSGIPFRNTWRS